jgi:hypothetical protein
MGKRPRTEVVVGAVAVAALTLGLAALATLSPVAPGSESQSNLTGVPAGAGFEALHEQGVTGANVSVGVVDVTAFDSDAGALSGRVRATRTFGRGPVATGGHGTAAATVVARTAPEADLYLATVDGIDSYGRAVGWLREQDVDVVVAPVSFYGRPGDGSGTVGTASRRAVEAGVVVVAPTGNLADSHWRGRDDARTANGTVAVADGRERMALSGPSEVTVWLSWDREHAGTDYTVELYRTDVPGSRLVARSRPFRADGTPNERIVTEVPPGEYALAIRGPPEPTGARLRLVSPTHEFARPTSRGSVVAPGTARGVLTVGAYDNASGRVEPFSSRGPTADGRVGVDVVAPDRRFAALTDGGFVGSSAATPYVGGLVALMLDADGRLSPARAELLVELTATDVGPPGVDSASGHGVVAPVRAVRAAANTTASG